MKYYSILFFTQSCRDYEASRFPFSPPSPDRFRFRLLSLFSNGIYIPNIAELRHAVMLAYLGFILLIIKSWLEIEVSRALPTDVGQ